MSVIEANEQKIEQLEAQILKLMGVISRINHIAKDRKYLMDTNLLCSNPPQNAGVWDMRNAIIKEIESIEVKNG